MSEERLELIKENVYMRSEIATISGIGIDSSLKEELELIEEIDRLNNIINEIDVIIYNEHITGIEARLKICDVLNKLQKLKDSD